MLTAEQFIQQTEKWILDVVIGCNFCPFARQVVKDKSIHYEVEPASDLKTCLESFARQCIMLDEDKQLATSLLILPNAVVQFHDYLDLVDLAEKFIEKQGYEGIYQVASFHPGYRFADAAPEDPSNYTNRSPYPMLHLLREDLVEQALEHYKEPEQIPVDNINFAKEKGLAYMKMLREMAMQLQ